MQRIIEYSLDKDQYRISIGYFGEIIDYSTINLLLRILQHINNFEKYRYTVFFITPHRFEDTIIEIMNQNNIQYSRFLKKRKIFTTILWVIDIIENKNFMNLFQQIWPNYRISICMNNSRNDLPINEWIDYLENKISPSWDILDENEIILTSFYHGLYLDIFTKNIEYYLGLILKTIDNCGYLVKYSEEL